MVCVGCNEKIMSPVAYAVMNKNHIPKGTTPTIVGKGTWVGLPVCLSCFVVPSNRKNKLKAHFALPADVKRMVGAAGSSSGIGG